MLTEQGNIVRDELRSAISALKNVALKYSQLSEEEKKEIRHLMYTQEGAFGKIILQGDKSPIEEMIRANQRLSKS